MRVCMRRAQPAQMLLLFYSDESYAMLGINATFTALSCNTTCMYGSCTGSTCLCQPGYSGTWCDQVACPNNCSAHGVCVNECVCDDGFSGDDCSIATLPNTWRQLTTAAGGFTARFGQSAVYDADADAMWFEASRPSVVA